MAATYSSLVGLAVGGKYEVRRVLGIGGMGVVCEAIHVDLGKKVAIKLIDKTMKESELIVARFRREARALGQIQSEHIVDVFDVGADPRVGLYMVMEHLPGEDLQSRLERDSRLDLTTAVMVAHQMARGLDKAHAAGVIHRDLKPANIFLTARDNGSLLVKLLDFGVSKVLNEVGGARITGSGAPIGTPLYMSPEQAEGKDDTDGRADIWSLGAVLYEALSGAPPFADRGSYHGTIVGILTSRPQLLHDAAPWVPSALASVVDAMLVHDRSARIKDAATVTKRLLEAYPAVLPDGTGRHTAVIVPTSSAVDAMGDTEFFSSQAFKEAQKSLSLDNDAKRTIPKGPRVSDEATRTAAATPIEMGHGTSSDEASSPSLTPPPSSSSSFELKTKRMDARTGGPKTDPMPWRSGPSSATGLAPRHTIEPLNRADISPDTQRDAALAVRADQLRWVKYAVIIGVIGSFAIGGFFVGRRETQGALDGGLPAATTSVAVTATAPASTAAIEVPFVGTAAAAGASGAGSASAAPGALLPPLVASSKVPPVDSVRHRRSPVTRPKASAPDSEPKPDEAPVPPPNPFNEPTSP